MLRSDKEFRRRAMQSPHQCRTTSSGRILSLFCALAADSTRHICSFVGYEERIDKAMGGGQQISTSRSSRIIGSNLARGKLQGRVARAS